MNTKLTIGLFGFGVVGEGIYRVLLETSSLHASIKKICIKHPDKKRDAPQELFTTDYNELLNDSEINLIVELIDDAEEAFKIASISLRKKKAVVSANKKMIAENLQALLNLQKEYDAPFLYEAAVCGSIPVLRNLEEYYNNDLLKSICGIVNGSTNFILTKMIDENLSYVDALAQAQQLGFAESNPALDVKGIDAANKLSILLLHAYGLITSPDKILTKGITAIQLSDAKMASEKSYKIKLTAQAYKLANGKIASFVLPQFVTDESQLYNVKNEFNGIVIESKLADKQFLYGKGAGRYPTSSAVLSDIAALRYAYKYEYRKLNSSKKYSLSSEFYLKLYISFSNWEDVHKWDFEWIEEYHSTEERQYIIGVIRYKNLATASWFKSDAVSVVLMPNGIIEEEEAIKKAMKKMSLKLAGIS
ncbi:MAG: homoserine dehydrogenase [Chitinophagaceae bacterium]